MLFGKYEYRLVANNPDYIPKKNTIHHPKTPAIHFVLESFDQLFAVMTQDFAQIYWQLLNRPSISAGATRADDRIIHIAASSG